MKTSAASDDQNQDGPTKMGRPPKPPGTTGRKFACYLSAEAVKALAELQPPGASDWKSALVSRLLVEEAERRRRERLRRRALGELHQLSFQLARFLDHTVEQVEGVRCTIARKAQGEADREALRALVEADSKTDAQALAKAWANARERLRS